MPSELRTIALFSSKRFLISLAIHIKKEGNEEMLKMDETRVRISGLCGRLFTCHMERPYETSEKKMLVAQSCPTLCNPMDYNPPGSSVHGILKTRTLEWVAIPFSKGSSQLKSNPGLVHCRPILSYLSHIITNTYGHLWVHQGTTEAT